MKYLTLLSLFLSLFQITKSQSTEDIIRQHIVAIGGEENWNHIHSIEIKCVTKANGNTVLIRKSAIRDTCIRQDIKIEHQRAERNDKNYYVVINGERGWTYLPADRNNIMSLYPYEIVEMKDELDYEDPFLNYMQKGRDIQLLNVEKIKGEEFYVFEITFATKKKSICYMNVQTLMINLIKGEGEPDENAKRFLDYKLLPEGIRMPMKVLGLNSSLDVQNITINLTFDKDLFEPSMKNNFSFYH